MKRVLVIEDNGTNMYLVRYILEKSGHEVIQARDGTSGIDLAIREKPDLVILDIQLPDIDGLDVVRRVLAMEPGWPAPIIALTSYAMPGDREKCLSAGCTGYIEKPIDPDTFLEEIEAHLFSQEDHE